MSAPQITHDTAVGLGTVAVGATGLGVQTMVGYGNLVVMGLNGLLAVGGLIFLYVRFRAHQEDQRYKRQQRGQG